MKNFAKSTLLALAICTAANAEGLYIGGELGYVSAQNKLNINATHLVTGNSVSGSFDERDGGFGYGVHVGYILAPEHRAYIAYARQSSDVKIFDSSENLKMQKYYLGYDYTPLIKPTLRGVLGAFIGGAKGEIDGDKSDDILYGAKLGLLREVDVHTDVELSLRLDRVEFDVEGDASGVRTRGDLEHSSIGLYVGYSYKF